RSRRTTSARGRERRLVVIALFRRTSRRRTGGSPGTARGRGITGRRRAGRLLRARRRRGRGRVRLRGVLFLGFIDLLGSLVLVLVRVTGGIVLRTPAVMLRAEVEIRDHEWDLGHRYSRRQRCQTARNDKGRGC